MRDSDMASARARHVIPLTAIYLEIAGGASGCAEQGAPVKAGRLRELGKTAMERDFSEARDAKQNIGVAADGGAGSS
ncbi:MAG: hypothetical protein ISR49_20810 [Alphaproteobacteria bacterium]|nr:hypothetical protein [Alphaproteobacteria bacterium]